MKLKETRQISQRWLIQGRLELLTPTSLSNGDPDPTVDLPIVLDPLEGRALLTGASLAGALRNYVRDYAGEGYAGVLFGGQRGDKEGEQSPLIVEDALGGWPDVELRDGVGIDPTTRTARDKEKYDRQLLAAGTTFDIGFELVVAEDPNPKQKEPLDQRLARLKKALMTALYGLQIGDIRLGGRKRRGYGRCRATGWQAWAYDLTQPQSLAAWLAHGRADSPWATHVQIPWKGEDILTWPQWSGSQLPEDDRQHFTIEANMVIDGSLLIRSGFETEHSPDVAHLASRRGEAAVPVVSGTSLAGVIRGQALRIARTVAPSGSQEVAKNFVNDLFGYMAKPKPQEDEDGQKKGSLKRASRVTVDESDIAGDYQELVQSRIKVDRFTGGAFESALFDEQPIYGGEFPLRMAIKNPDEAQMGLLLLVLKDLWTGHTAIGGETSLGRGRLRGRSAVLTAMIDKDKGREKWRLEAINGQGLRLVEGEADRLRDFVKAFNQQMTGEST